MIVVAVEVKAAMLLKVGTKVVVDMVVRAEEFGKKGLSFRKNALSLSIYTLLNSQEESTWIVKSKMVNYSSLV